MTLDGGPQVLFVEEEAGNSGTAEALLRRTGVVFSAVRARSCEEAAQALHQRRLDLIVVDAAVRGRGDGTCLLSLIGQAAGAVPVVVLSDTFDPEAAAAHLEAGAADCVPKGSIRLLACAFRRAIARGCGQPPQSALSSAVPDSLYRTLVESAAYWAWRVDPDGRYVFASFRENNLLGYTHEEVIGRTPFDFMPAGEAERVAKEFAAIAAERRPFYGLRNTNRRKDGQLAVLETYGVPLFGQQGEYLGYCGMDHDVTERVRSEEALSTSQLHLRLFLDANPDLCFLKDTELRYLMVNMANARFFGREEKDILGLTDYDLMPPEGAARCQETDLQAIQERRVVVSVEEVEGRTYEAHKFPIISDGRIFGSGGIIRDTTERCQTEKALRRRHAVDAALAELSTALLQEHGESEDLGAVVLRHAQALTDSPHGYVGSVELSTGDFVAHTLTAMMGVECHVAGTDARIVFPHGADGKYPGLWGHALNARESICTNAPAEHPAASGLPHGHIALRRFLAVPVVVRDRVLGQVAVANAPRDYGADDVEAVRRLAELYGLFLQGRRTRAVLRKSEEQLRQAFKMEAVGRLAGGVAHDFNNMLQVILSNAAMAQDEVAPGSVAHECLRDICTAGEHSAELTRQLLGFARKQTITPKVLDLNEAVEGCLLGLEYLLGERGELVWKPGSHLGRVRVDPAQIQQVLTNLVANACDAATRASTVTIATSNAVIDETFCEAHPGSTPGEYVLLTVTDNGCGIDSATMANLFEPFFTTKGVGKGLGLGLATVYGIVRQNDGTIDVHSRPQEGTRFDLYWPRHGSETSGETPAQASHELRRGNETILLVEDDEAILALTEKQLQVLGYNVLATGSPEEAIGIAERHVGDIRLVVSDVTMPTMSGPSLLEHLRRIKPGLQCLFVSGYSADILAPGGQFEPGVHFLSKPFSLHALAEKARSILG